MTNPYLSIIIPALNEENRLPGTLEQVSSFLSMQPYSYEVIIVENGSQDQTYEVARAFSENHPHFRVLREAERGKGRAVRRGMLEARGEYRFMADADLSMPITEVNRFIPPDLTGVDIAIASREAPGAVRYNEPAYRHLGGRAVNTVIRLLALPGLHDTQCGFKCFRGPVADDLFQYQTLTGWAFDVELLYIARKRRYRIIELPIPWFFNAESKVHAVRDAIRMGVDIMKIRWNDWCGMYRRKPSPGTSGSVKAPPRKYGR